jgi:hypothetical protein
MLRRSFPLWTQTTGKLRLTVHEPNMHGYGRDYIIEKSSGGSSSNIDISWVLSFEQMLACDIELVMRLYGIAFASTTSQSKTESG